MTRVFVSWSGGKDCSLACYRALASGLEVRYLANTITGNGQRSCSHGISAGIIRMQSKAIGIPVAQRRTTRNTYEAEFIKMLENFKKEGITGGVFGDIDFNAHREWIERVCHKAGMTPYLPLWLEGQDRLIREFAGAGFEAIVVAAKSEFFGEEVLGRKIDNDFIKHLEELHQTRGVTLCGEAGEYHTLVLNGPFFQKRLEILEARKTLRKGIRFLEILRADIRNK